MDTQAQIIESLKSMMLSCYTYGGIEKTSWNFKQYISPYQSQLPEDVFEKAYQEQAEHLSNFEVEHGVYTDGEGCTYNQLKEKK